MVHMRFYMYEVNFVDILDILAFNRIYSLAIFRGLTARIRKRNFAHALPTIVIA